MADLRRAEVNFDGITYAKGASVLKQLVAWVGEEEFLAGLRAATSASTPTATPRWPTCSSALEATSGPRPSAVVRGVAARPAGVNTLRPEFEPRRRRQLRELRCIVQTAPTDVAALRRCAPHRLAIGPVRRRCGHGQLVADRAVRGRRDRRRAPTSRSWSAWRQPDLLLVNDDDLTYARSGWTSGSLRTLRTGGIARLAESLPRALCWWAAWDMTRDAELATRDYVALVVAGARSESDVGLLQTLNAQASASGADLR